MVQPMPEGWIFQALWKHHAETRAKVCVPDTVLIKDGAPYRWLFTSRQGEVVRKRALDLVAVRDRFSKISLVHKNNEQRLVATLRERGTSAFDPASSIPRHLDSEKFTEFVSSRLSASGNSIVAIQAFVPSRGEAGTAFHNTYEAHPTDQGKRPVTTTHRLRYWRSGGKHDEGRSAATEEKSGTSSATSGSLLAGGSDSVQPAMAPVRVRDQRLCGDFDATTLAVVKYVERQHRVRVVTMSCEYIVDEDHRIWFTWGWNLAAIKHRKQGREEEEEMQQRGEEDSGGVGTKKESSGFRRLKAHQRPSVMGDVGSKDAGYAEKVLSGAVERVESGFDGNMGGASNKTMGGSSRRGGSGKNDNGGFGIKRSGQTSPRGVPGPKSCQGDFCDFVVHDPAVLSQTDPGEEKRSGRGGGSRGSGGRSSADLFSATEMSKLSGLGLDDMLQGSVPIGAPTRATDAILFKSIALARQEKRGMAHHDQMLSSSSSSHLNLDGGSELLNPEDLEFEKPRESVTTRSTDAHRMKVQKVKASQLGLDGGAANYYKTCRVCSTCYRVYTTLDAARDMLKMQQEAASMPRGGGRGGGGRGRVMGGSSVLSNEYGGPSLQDVDEFETSVRSKAHTFGASRRATNRAAQQKSQAAARRRNADRETDDRGRSSVLLPEIQQNYRGGGGSSSSSSSSGGGGGGGRGGRNSPTGVNGGSTLGGSTETMTDEERKQRVSNMPWKETQRKDMADNPKKALQERRRQREMTQVGHEMDRFQNLEEYVRKSAPSPERDAESSVSFFFNFCFYFKFHFLRDKERENKRQVQDSPLQCCLGRMS